MFILASNPLKILNTNKFATLMFWITQKRNLTGQSVEVDSKLEKILSSIKDNQIREQILDKLKIPYSTNPFRIHPKRRISLESNMKPPYIRLKTILPNVFGNGEKFELKAWKDLFCLSFLKPFFNKDQEKVTFWEFKMFRSTEKVLSKSYKVDGLTFLRNDKDYIDLKRISGKYIFSITQNRHFLKTDWATKIGMCLSTPRISPFIKLTSELNLKKFLFQKKTKNLTNSNEFWIFRKIPMNACKNTNYSSLKNSAINCLINRSLNHVFKHPWIVNKLISVFLFRSHKLRSLEREENSFISKLKNLQLISKLRSGVLIGRAHPIDGFILGNNIRGYKENSIGPTEINHSILGRSFIEIKNDLLATIGRLEIFVHADAGFCSRTQNIFNTLKSAIIASTLAQPISSLGASIGLGINILLPRIKNSSPKIGVTYSVPLINTKNEERCKFTLDLIS